MNRVKLYMRVENQSEICVGTAQTMDDIPRLLEEIAALWRGRFAADMTPDHDHKLTQHRDGRPKWCNTCRRFADGQSVSDTPSRVR